MIDELITNTYDIKHMFIEEYLSHKAAGTLGETIEIIGSSFTADKPTIFGKPNADYIRREIDWYNSQSLNVYDIEAPVPTIWKEVADDEGFVNSNYGFLIFSKDNGQQFYKVYKTLMDSPDGRRGTMVYTRPSIHSEWNENGRTDFICTNAVNYFIRGGAVHAVVQMRSNDVVFGYRNDFAWQDYVLQRLVSTLQDAGRPVVKGKIIWQAASLHIYSRHYKFIEEYVNEA